MLQTKSKILIAELHYVVSAAVKNIMVTLKINGVFNSATQFSLNNIWALNEAWPD